MKTNILRQLRRDLLPTRGGSRGGLIFASCLLLSATASLAQSSSPSVSTVSGGRAGPPLYGYVDGNTQPDAQFHTPIGLALDSFGFGGSGPLLYVADRDNNAVRKLDLNGNQTITFATNVMNRINQPVGVAVDTSGNLYVLNRGNGANGTVLSFNRFGNFLGTNAAGLSAAEGIALDGGGNIYVTVNSNTVRQIYPGSYPGAQATITTIATAGTWLRGLTIRQDGTIAVCDAGRHGIWAINPGTGVATTNSGFNGAGDQFGTWTNAQFNQPFGVAAAGNSMLVVTDYGNNRVKVVDPQGTSCNLYGVCSNNWITNSPDGPPGWKDGNGCPCEITCQICDLYAESRLPAGVLVDPSGDVYTTEDYYHVIRHTTGTGLTGLGGGNGSGTNVVTVTAPTILSPVSGYYPMGQLVQVSSPNPNVYYTTDGSDPTTNSPQVTMNGNIGTIHWFNSTNDLTGLAVKAFVGTNASVTVRGQPVSNNDVGVPSAPTSSGAIFAGIGSTIVVPVVVDLRTNVQVKSFQFRVEVSPVTATNPVAAGSSGFFPLDIGTNDFVLLAAANAPGSTGAIAIVSYTIGNTTGLQISALGTNANISFQSHAVVTLLKVPIPPNAHVGDTYSVQVLYPSATSDALNNNVPLTAMPAATILVTNILYTVGDSASPNGAWYNAGGFGDGDLLNADVNNAFYAALGLRVPYAFSDVFNSMDAFPPDAPGFVGGDGQIRFLDWQLILRRSLRLDTNNWARAWSSGGVLVNTGAILTPHSLVNSPQPLVVAPWYKQVLLGGVSVGNVATGNQVSVPVYVKLGDGSTLAGLQFRAVVTALNGAVPLTQAPQFIAAPGIPAPSLQQSFQASATAFGWPLGSFSFQSRSSNFVGWLILSVPPGTPTGGTYGVSFANADGSPDLYTQYDFETRSASVVVNATAPPASICSDEWKLHFFGSLTAPNAADMADPDADGVPNWMEYVAGTDPTDPNSKLRFLSVSKQVVSGQSQLGLNWLTAPGKAYEVQWSPVPGGTWNTLGTASGDGSFTTYTDSAAGSARFYRLRVLP